MTRRSHHLCILLSLVAGLTLVGCGAPPDDQRTDSLDPQTAGRADLPEEALAALDLGNTAYRDGEFQTALDHYREVTRLAEDSPSGWFGIYMAQMKLGQTAAADSALQRAQGLAPGASLIHDTLPEGGTP